MADFRRSRQKGGSFFFTLVTHRRKPLLTRTDVRTALRESIEVVRKDQPFYIDAWVLLPDHLHCIWTLPYGDNEFPRRWGRIKAGVSRHLKTGLTTSSDMVDWPWSSFHWYVRDGIYEPDWAGSHDIEGEFGE